MTGPPSRSLADIVSALAADTVPYLSCDECLERMCAYVERLAAHPQCEDVAMRKHLLACPACADEAAALIELYAEDLARDTGAS